MRKIRLLAEGVTIRLNVGGEFVYLDTVGQEVEVSEEEFLFLQEQLNSIPAGFIQVIGNDNDEREQQKGEGEQGSGGDDDDDEQEQVSGRRKRVKRE